MIIVFQQVLTQYKFFASHSGSQGGSNSSSSY